MAKQIFIITIFFFTAVFAEHSPERNRFVQYVKKTSASEPAARREKLTQMKLYWHDIVSGRSPTSIPIINAKNPTTAFGQVNMIDNPLTDGPDMNGSKIVGRAQGFYAAASQETVELIMAMNFCFSEGKYNGSTITVLGHNKIFNDVREMPVIGGTGLFRLARGYVQVKTVNLDMKTGDATVEYNISVLHY